MPTTPAVEAARAGLAGLADPTRAVEMRAYMKSEMPFYGVPAPARRALAGRVLAANPPATRDDWLAAITTLWREATRREERYMAIEFLGHRRHAAWRTVDLMPLYDEMIVTGAWWDFVDEIAIRSVGPLHISDPDTVSRILREWATDADRWRRRASVIAQIGAKSETDRELLTHTIEANIADRDFFLRKAIGWALRAYAKTDPDWVRAFVTGHPDLSSLSVREAVRNL